MTTAIAAAVPMTRSVAAAAIMTTRAVAAATIAIAVPRMKSESLVPVAKARKNLLFFKNYLLSVPNAAGSQLASCAARVVHQLITACDFQLEVHVVIGEVQPNGGRVIEPRARQMRFRRSSRVPVCQARSRSR